MIEANIVYAGHGVSGYDTVLEKQTGKQAETGRNSSEYVLICRKMWIFSFLCSIIA